MLITWADTSTARTTVRTVAENRVIGKGVDYAPSANQHAIASVAVDHVLIDGRT